jgi:hypothetical protein
VAAAEREIWTFKADVEARDLKRAAYRLAQSDNTDDLRALYAGLQSDARLMILDEQQDYLNLQATQLRVAGVFRHLMRNPSPLGHQLLVALTREATFNDTDARRELLIKALAVVRPSPPEAVQYWSRHAEPGGIFVHFVVEALCRNGSPPAVQLLGSILSSPDHPENHKSYWFRDAVLRHRNEATIVEMCARLLGSPLSSELKVVMVMALIDHDPDEWYAPDHFPVPPPRAEAGELTRQWLLRLLQQARATLECTEKDELLIDAVIEELSGGQTS